MYYKPLPSQKYLLECLDYNLITGEIFWKQRPLHHFTPKKVSAEHSMHRWNVRYAGKLVNKKSLGSSGYLEININKQSYLLHRLIWKLIYGEDPTELIDHRDTDRFNLRKTNLRCASHSQNQSNSGVYKNNTLQIKGVRLLPSGRFPATIVSNTVHRHLGCFDTAGDAHRIYCKAADQLHGEFANHG